MRVVFLVPRRNDNGHRDQLWAACKARWQALHPDWPIIEGYHDEGLFNRSAAVNKAAREAGDWDVAIIIDSDVMVDPVNVRAAVETAHATGRVTWAHRRWRGIGKAATATLLADPSPMMEPDFVPGGIEKTNPISWSCCVAITREAWDTIGGFDERFKGWGWEDMAFQCLAVGLVGHERIEGDVHHLWHPRTPGLGKLAPGIDGVVSARLGRRYMLALRRDHNMHDRHIDSDTAEMERDMGNLRRADARLARQSRRLGMPDWDDWWPTLEELRDRVPMPSERTVALIVHSGGVPESWDARSGYLRQALASLTEQVPFEWERRVVFSDWGDQPDLAEIAAEFGFDVAGPRHRVGYTKSMQAMWKYIHGTKAEYAFVTEDDFVFDRAVELDQLVDVMAERPHIAQMAMLRGPFYDAEMDPDTLLGHPKDAFEPKANGAGTAWLEHSRFFTANPMLMRRALTQLPWPNSKHSEAVFGRRLFARRDLRAAFWGTGEPWISHIGEVRAGGGY